MHLRYVALVIYLVLGLFGYASYGGVGTGLDGKQKTPVWRKALVVLLWPLAMIGAI